MLGDLTMQRVPPFVGIASQNGSQIDIDGDGDLDIGDIPNGGQANMFFQGRSNIMETGGIRTFDGTDSEEFRIGTGTFTVTSNSFNRDTFIDFIRRRNPGNPGTNNTSYARAWRRRRSSPGSLASPSARSCSPCGTVRFSQNRSRAGALTATTRRHPTSAEM